ncbi:MAG: hypothetical protein F9K19_07125 [Rhizobiaceae bacterium]|nr:MAG: hypothetical protein F9K19_07125 [Rhizobiaceae bacterium]CAG1012566.1 hypothetical protein RHIZO_04282 [Rhizobiaceae bacterium]
MRPAQAIGNDQVRPIDSAFMLRVFYAFAILALLSVAISLAGKWFGRSIAMAGHTDDTTVFEVVLGNDVLAVPANAIRFESARRNGVAERLDLYLHWPDMTGYSPAAAADFNRPGDQGRILFLRFEPRTMSRDMSGRYDPIYSKLVDPAGTPGPAGVTFHRFKDKAGYLDEVLAVAGTAGEPLVARCLTGPAAENSFAPCERDLHVGDFLSLTYRFPLGLLSDWQTLDAAVRDKAAALIRTSR